MNWRSHHEWMAIIRQWQKTDMTKTEFCIRKKLSIKCFSYHYYKDQKSNEEKVLTKKSFAKIVCEEETRFFTKICSD